MTNIADILKNIKPFFPLIGGAFIFFVLYFVIRNILRKNRRLQQDQFTRRSISIIVGAGIVFLLMVTFPDSQFRDDLMTLIGILVSAAIAVSSATFIANTMSGFFLRSIRSFNHGDFIKVGEYTGCVSEKSFFHTEIQTEERQFIMLPNKYLINNPVTVIRKSGVVVSAKVSLGYDVERITVEQLLGKAAEDAGLESPFVQILDLGDFSVTYRCCGILKDTKNYYSVQSLLRSKMLDQLHHNQVEIVSPNFVNQRRFDIQHQFIPEKQSGKKVVETQVELGVPEDLVFDKAEAAISVDELKEQLAKSNNELHELEKLVKKEEGDPDVSELKQKLENKKKYCQILQKKIDRIRKNHD